MTLPHGTSFVGVEVGTNRDPSAVAVVEVEWRDVEEVRTAHFNTRFLEVMAATTRYPQIARRTAEVCTGIKARGRRIGTLFVNITGSGTPPLDLIREKLPSEQTVGVYFNHGDRRVESDAGVNLGKALLVSRLKLLLQADRLQLPRTAEARLLSEELLDFHREMEPKANELTGAFRVGTRDELVTAIGLATQVDHPIGSSPWDIIATTWGPVEDLLR